MLKKTICQFGVQFFLVLGLSAHASAASNTAGQKTDLNYAQVTFVEARQSANGSWCFNTAVRHNDEGWNHYADEWIVVDPQGNQLASRVLAHPHEQEQPFTRSQCGIDIPENSSTVSVKAKCNLHGFGGQEVLVNLSVPAGDNFRVIER